MSFLLRASVSSSVRKGERASSSLGFVRHGWGYKDGPVWTSLVAQWLRIRLPMQGTRVRSLGREDPTCLGAPKPVRYNYGACALEPTSHNY